MMRSSIKIVLILSLLMLIACVYPEKCRESDAVHLEKTPFLGIGYRVVSGFDKLPGVETKHGLRVAQVVSGSAAEKAGIKVNDIIIAYDSVKLKDREESELLQSFGNYIKKEKAVGENISLTVIRTETAFEGKRDKEGLSIKNRDDIEDLLDDQKLGETLEFSVKREAHLIEIVATLGEKGNPALEKPPENRLLFPEYETLSCPYSDLGNQLIDEFDIGDVYLDLLKRYEDDEMESDTFRLNLFRYVHRDPLRFPLVAEKISGDLDDCGKKIDLPEIIRYGSNLLDESSEDGQAIIGIPSSREPEAHLSFIRNVVLSALTMRNRAFETLEEEDKEFLFENLPLLIENGFETDSTEAESEEEIQKNERALRLLGEADYGALLKSAEILAQLANAEWLSDFRGAMIDYHSPETQTIRGIGGDIIYAEDTGAGLIVIGGAGPNRYEMSPAVLIDLGGNDFYGDGDDSDFSENPLSVLIDCSGNDEYSATATFAQGAGILGTGILMDLAGDDTYHSTRFSQGTGVLGVGILADLEGDDRYFGQEFNQGVAFWGMGILIDSEGVDSYRSHLVAQGVGGPKGMGLLMDQSGDDSYYATGKEPSSYGTPGIFNGYSQGFGIGFRHHASGGIGVLIDSSGNDRFRAGNFSQGGGYYFGLGILRNAGDGNDEYIASRYGQGASAHSAAGIVIDDGGNDRYTGHVGALQGAAWDLGIAALIDMAGNDTYDSDDRFFSQGAAAHNGFSMFIDGEGKDRYIYRKEKKASNNTYHGGYSISLIIDNGGDPDMYNDGVEGNNRIFLEGEYGIRADLDGDVREMLENNIFRKLLTD